MNVSTTTISKLQESVNESKKEQPQNAQKNSKDEAVISELKKELNKKQEIFQKFKQGVILSNQKSLEVSQTLEKILNSKEKIVEERNTTNFSLSIKILISN